MRGHEPDDAARQQIFDPVAVPFATAGGDLKDIQELLGHSTSQITSDIYTSVLVELEVERDKAEKAAALVPRQPRRAA
jgi:hypothetical protein